MNSLKPWHLLVLAVVFVVLFGSKRLPDSARSLGRSLRIFKSEVREMNKEDSVEDKKTDPNSDK
jgi:sec-independent protein translocase protein TatA